MATETRKLEHFVDSEEEMRRILGHPSYRVVDKVIDHVDQHCRAFLARSPFVLIASADGAGHFDVSPKGDPPGFVQVLDERTLAIPERLGNRRADTFVNIFQNPGVGLLFLIPGVRETLRVNGKARLSHDRWLREEMAIGGKVPELALIVTVQEAFLHCGKCVIRSRIWQPDEWPDSDGAPTLARTMIDHGRLADSLGDMEQAIDNDARKRLY